MRSASVRSPAALGRRQPAIKAYMATEATPVSRTFAEYSLYKGRGAVQLKAIAPTWSQKAGPNGSRDFAVEREGVVLLEAAPIQANQGPQSSYGVRNYAWDQKITFALKATELAALSSFDSSFAATGKELQFFHDPNKGQQGLEGQESKTLKMSMGQQNDGSMLLMISKSGQSGKGSVTVPVSTAEFKVIQHIAAYLIPRLLGFDMVMEAGTHSS